MKRLILSTLAAGALLAATNATALEETPNLPKTHVKVVGGLSNLTAYRNHEQPFWTKTVPEKSDGRVTADIKGFNEMGLKGPEIMRLIGDRKSTRLNSSH